MTPFRILPWVLLLMLLVFTGATYGDVSLTELPQRINAAGRVTDTMPKTLVNWFLLPGIAVLTQLGLTVITVLLPRRPELFNFPEKDRFLRLPPSYRAPVIREMQLTLDVTGTVTTLMLCVVQFVLWRAAIGASGSANGPWIAVAAIFVGPAILLMVTRVTSATEAAEKQWKAAGSPAA
jgi:uncharacterized membrane protein